MNAIPEIERIGSLARHDAFMAARRKIELVVTSVSTQAIVLVDGAKRGAFMVAGIDEEAAEKATAYALSACGFYDDPRVIARSKKDLTLAKALRRTEKSRKVAR